MSPGDLNGKPCALCGRMLTVHDSRRELVVQVLSADGTLPEAYASCLIWLWYCPPCREACRRLFIPFGVMTLELDSMAPHAPAEESLVPWEVVPCALCGAPATGPEASTIIGGVLEYCYAGPICVERKAPALICKTCCDGWRRARTGRAA